MLDIDRIRADFPILRESVYGKPLVYLDNAATTQKPQVVIDRIIEYYCHQNSNVHRGVHSLSEHASEMYESVRENVRAFINAENVNEIVFTRGATESINLVADSFGNAYIRPGDEIITTQMEHHSNFVPWQALCERKGAKLKVAPVDENGILMKKSLQDLITEKTRLIALCYVSNAIGTVNPVKEIIEFAHARNVPVLIDAAQAIQHRPLDVRALDCDFMAFSGHKMYAETGIGVLYGKRRWLETMPPYQYGGGMIDAVSLGKTTYADPPFKFEAGTVNVAAALSLSVAIQYIQAIGFSGIIAHEKDLLRVLVEKLGALKEVTIYGKGTEQDGIVSFNLAYIHPYDVGMVLDKLGIAVRTGKHCAEPLMSCLGINGTVRASIALYNTLDEVDQLVSGVKKATSLLL